MALPPQPGFPGKAPIPQLGYGAAFPRPPVIGMGAPKVMVGGQQQQLGAPKFVPGAPSFGKVPGIPPRAVGVPPSGGPAGVVNRFPISTTNNNNGPAKPVNSAAAAPQLQFAKKVVAPVSVGIPPRPGMPSSQQVAKQQQPVMISKKVAVPVKKDAAPKQKKKVQKNKNKKKKNKRSSDSDSSSSSSSDSDSDDDSDDSSSSSSSSSSDSDSSSDDSSSEDEEEEEEEDTNILLGGSENKKKKAVSSKGKKKAPKEKKPREPRVRQPRRRQREETSSESSDDDDSSSDASPSRSPTPEGGDLFPNDRVNFLKLALANNWFELKADNSDNAAELAIKDAKPPRPKIPKTPTDFEAALAKAQETVQRQETALRTKDASKEVSLGTSKTNYIDPRVSAAWAKKYNVPITKIFTKTLIEKFPWAMNVDENYVF